ncbi:hypothetical protein TIFTF001_038568 [Ficus carica]|uniref:NB-ARC domain-containing protein n=1 Tax=Ficus carica TaxID=3494 RepID=A0AA88EAS9_FICCA|nr:hypothetical protein TIFTF001_038568 [Ficus carica]
MGFCFTALADRSMSRVIGELSSLLTGEKKEGTEVYRQVQRMKEELESIKIILEVESEEEELSQSVKNWVKQAIDAAELLKDVLEENFLQVLGRPHRLGFIKFLRRAGRSIGELNSHGNLAFTIEYIIAVLREIKERGRRHNLVERASGSRTTIVERCHPQFASPFLDKCIVGVDSATNDLIQRLMDQDSRRAVISLVGTGGIGKTTLAKKVLNNEVVRRHFRFFAWIDVSPLYKVEELLKIIIVGICRTERCNVGEVDMLQGQELISILRKLLQSKRYMIVFDGICEQEFWNVMKDALPDNGNGSRIIITTHCDTIAASCKESSVDHVHKLEPLSETASWELFCSIAFKYGTERHCPLVLEKLALQILRLCEGFPLAIVAIAGLLSTKESTVSEWQKQLDILSSALISDPHRSNVSKIVSFCFDDLSSALQSCLLFYSSLPKDTLISVDDLFKLWIAEGLIKEERGETLEEVAEEYFHELIQRNLVGPCELLPAPGLMHEIKQLKANEFSFNAQSRRLSIYSDVCNDNVLKSVSVKRIFNYALQTVKGTVWLQELVISGLTAETLCVRYVFRDCINYLETQILYISDKVKHTDFVNILSSIHGLPCHVRYVQVEKLLAGILSLHCLRVVSLRHTRLTDEPLKYLCGLPNLESLGLYQAYEGEQLHFEKGGFQKLKLLVLRELQGLKALDIEQGALPLLTWPDVGQSSFSSYQGSAFSDDIEDFLFVHHDRQRISEVLSTSNC